MRIFLFFLALLYMTPLAPSRAAGADKAGDVVKLQGNAVVQRADRTLQARVRTELQREDAVQTRSRARMKMLFVDDSVLTLGPNSRLIVQRHLTQKPGQPSRSIYHLVDGKLKAVAGRPDFFVRTPTAFAAARGTVFKLWYDSAADLSGVEVQEGSVEVSNVREEITGMQLVNAGQFTIIPKDGPPSPPQPSSREAGAEDEEDDGGPALSASPVEMEKEGLRDSFEGLLGSIPPIQQVPIPISRVNLNLQFRFP